jgi:hypothetical protein
VTCDGRLFQTSAPETGNARLPIEERVLGTMTRSDDAERKPGRPAVTFILMYCESLGCDGHIDGL